MSPVWYLSEYEAMKIASGRQRRPLEHQLRQDYAWRLAQHREKGAPEPQKPSAVRHVEVAGLAEITEAFEDGVRVGDRRRVRRRDLPLGARVNLYGLEALARLVGQGHLLCAVLEARLNSRLYRTGKLDVFDGDDGGGAGQQNLSAHDVRSSARDSERTEDGTA